jgi:CubicO group peptidase (beta-lactamase class C family)
MDPRRRVGLLVGVACLTLTSVARPDATAAGLCQPSVAALDASIRMTMSQGAPGMVVGVARRGQPLFVRPYGTANLEHDVPVRRATVFKLASVTKQFTAAAVLRLVQRGRLSLDDELARFVPELPQAGMVTLRQLLVHTSGLPDYAEDPEGQRTKSIARSSQDMVAWIARLEPKFLFEPGTRWAYSNSNYALLGVVVERVSGKSLDVFFREDLFQPAGLTRTEFDNPGDVVAHRAQGYKKAKTAPGGYANAEWISPTIPGAAGGLRTTVDDLLQWSHALFSGNVLQPATLRQMIAPGTLSDGRTTKFGMPEAWQRGLDSDYGMGVFITNTGVGRRVWHGGDIEGFSTWLAHYPEADMTIAVLQNSESADIDEKALHEALFGPHAEGCEHRRRTTQPRTAPSRATAASAHTSRAAAAAGRAGSSAP